MNRKFTTLALATMIFASVGCAGNQPVEKSIAQKNAEAAFAEELNKTFVDIQTNKPARKQGGSLYADRCREQHRQQVEEARRQAEKQGAVKTTTTETEKNGVRRKTTTKSISGTMVGGVFYADNE
jgi:hypothetical protein